MRLRALGLLGVVLSVFSWFVFGVFVCLFGFSGVWGFGELGLGIWGLGLGIRGLGPSSAFWAGLRVSGLWVLGLPGFGV